MRVLALAAPLDGAGRTTLAAWLGLEAERAGAGPVVWLDAAAEPALLGWAEEADLSRPFAERWDASCTPIEFQRLDTAGVGLVVVDCPALDQPERLASTLAVADLAVIVVQPRAESLAATGRMADAMDAAGKPFLFVVNRASEDGDMTTATAVALAQYGTVSPVILPERADLAEAAPSSPSSTAPAMEPSAGAGSEIGRLWEYLLQRLERCAPTPQSTLPRSAMSQSAMYGSSDEGRERRRHARHSFEQYSTFTHDGRVFPCRVRDISAGGLSFVTQDRPALGARVTLHLPYLGEFVAEVVRHQDDIVGLRFAVEENRRADLVEELTALIGAGRTAAPQEAGDELLVRKKHRA